MVMMCLEINTAIRLMKFVLIPHKLCLELDWMADLDVDVRKMLCELGADFFAIAAVDSICEVLYSLLYS